MAIHISVTKCGTCAAHHVVSSPGLLAVFAQLRSQAPTLWNTSIEVVQVWRAWYFFSCEYHFIVGQMSSPSPVQSCLLRNVPSGIAPHLTDLKTDTLQFTKVMLVLEWIKDTHTQIFTINFLTKLKDYRNLLILQLIWALTTGHNKVAQTGVLGGKKSTAKVERG